MYLKLDRKPNQRVRVTIDGKELWIKVRLRSGSNPIVLLFDGPREFEIVREECIGETEEARSGSGDAA